MSYVTKDELAKVVNWVHWRAVLLSALVGMFSLLGWVESKAQQMTNEILTARIDELCDFHPECVARRDSARVAN